VNYRNILLIDDDLDDQEIFMTAVNDVFNSVMCKAMDDASDALKKLIAKELNPDVIFLDLNMPLMSGQKFLVELKKVDSLNHIPVIIFSTSSQPATIALMKELGAKEFITKPGNFDMLINLLRPLLNNNATER
jgi:DNA-binding NtrC family response regulator